MCVCVCGGWVGWVGGLGGWVGWVGWVGGWVGGWVEGWVCFVRVTVLGWLKAKPEGKTIVRRYFDSTSGM